MSVSAVTFEAGAFKSTTTTAAPTISPIPGTTKRHRLEENLGAVNVELSADDLRRIDAASSLASGARYSEGAQKMIDR